MGRAAKREDPAQDVAPVLRLAQGLPLGVALVSDGHIRWANPALAELAGRTQPAELDGVPFADLFADADQVLIDCARTRPVEAVLKNAPRRAGNFFRVPPVLDPGE